MKKQTPTPVSEQAKTEAVKILAEAVERAVAVLTGVQAASSQSLAKLENSRLLTSKQAATRMGYNSVWSIYRLLKAKKINGYRLGGRTLRFDPDELDQCLGSFRLKAATLSPTAKRIGSMKNI